MPKTPEDFRAAVARKIQDQAAKLTQQDVDAYVTQAISQRYSQDRPQEVVTDVVADGSADLPLPASGGNGPVFEIGFSIVEQLEYPIGDVPETIILDSEWRMYQSPTGTKIRMLSTVPPNAALVRVSWSARHTDNGSTVPLQDFEAVTDFAASLCAEALAAIYAQTRDNTVAADVVNYRTKSQEYLGLAKALRQRYYNAMGITEGAQGAAQQGPAIALGDMDNTLQAGVDRLIHSKHTR
jgi:hypothetical protein